MFVLIVTLSSFFPYWVLSNQPIHQNHHRLLGAYFFFVFLPCSPLKIYYKLMNKYTTLYNINMSLHASINFILKKHIIATKYCSISVTYQVVFLSLFFLGICRLRLMSNQFAFSLFPYLHLSQSSRLSHSN